MANALCRLHGGKSTGPRTAAGLARSRKARLVHGARAGDLLALRSAAAHSARRLARLTDLPSPAEAGFAKAGLRREIPAGHGVHRSVFSFPPDTPGRTGLNHGGNEAQRKHKGGDSTPLCLCLPAEASAKAGASEVQGHLSRENGTVR